MAALARSPAAGGAVAEAPPASGTDQKQRSVLSRQGSLDPKSDGTNLGRAQVTGSVFNECGIMMRCVGSWLQLAPLTQAGMRDTRIRRRSSASTSGRSGASGPRSRAPSAGTPLPPASPAVSSWGLASGFNAEERLRVQG
eukprot:3115252-Rhodomonas_salina.2